MAESGTPEAQELARQADESAAMTEQALLLGSILGAIRRLEPALCERVLDSELCSRREIDAVLTLRANIMTERASLSAESSGAAVCRARAIRHLGAVFHAVQQLEGRSLEHLAHDPEFLYAKQARLVIGLRESLDDAGHGTRGGGLRLERVNA